MHGALHTGVSGISLSLVFIAQQTETRIRRRAAVQASSVSKDSGKIFLRIADIYRKASQTDKANRWLQYLKSYGLQLTTPDDDEKNEITARDKTARGVSRDVPCKKNTAQAEKCSTRALNSQLDNLRQFAAWSRPVPSATDLEDLRAWRSSVSQMSWSVILAKVLDLCKADKVHLAEICLAPLLQVEKVPAGAGRIILDFARSGLPGLLLADSLMERLVAISSSLPGAGQAERVLFKAGPGFVNLCIKEGHIWHAERWLILLLQMGYKDEALRGRFCEHLASLDVLRAESWMTAWVSECIHAEAPEPRSRHIAALCHGFLRDPLTYFKAQHWLEFAVEVGIQLDGTEFFPILEELIQSTRIKKRPYILQSLIRKFVKHGRIALAEELAGLCLKYAIQEKETISELMTQLAQHGRQDLVMPWIDKISCRRLTPDAQLFATCIQAGARRDVAAASELLAIMESGLVETNCYVYSAVINTCAEADNSALAVAWFDTAKAASLEPNRHCYNAVLKAFARSQEADAAASWLADMSAKSLTPDAISFNSAISAMVGTGTNSVSRAGEIISQMRAAGITPSMQTYKNLMQVAAKGGDVYQAEAWYGCMVDAGFFPDSNVLRMLMNAAATSGEVSRAEWWWEALGRMAPPSEIEYNTLMKAYARTSQIQKAEDLYASMLRRCAPSEVTFGILMDGRANAGHVAGVSFWQQRFSEAGGEINLVMHNLLLKACSRAEPKDCAAAEATLRLMLRNAVQPNFITLQTLEHVVGKPAAQELCKELQLDWETLRRGQGRSLPLRSSGQLNAQRKTR